MKKVCLQAGHKGLTSGSTGASGERDWTTKIVPMIADKLRDAGVEVYETDALGYEDIKVTDTDWDLFLAVHYDADIYNNSGGFVDHANPETDMATEKSQQLARALSDYYFDKTGIKNQPERSCTNTRNYYMWKYLSEPTPCVIIECGVGARKPEDYETLRNYELISRTIADGILIGLGIKNLLEDKIDALEEELKAMRESRDKWRTEAKKLKAQLEQLIEERDKEVGELKTHRDLLQKDLAEANVQIDVLKRYLSTNKTPLSFYGRWERFISIFQ